MPKAKAKQSETPNQKQNGDSNGASGSHVNILNFADIAQRAYFLYEARGTDGHDVEDWLQAEREILAPPAAVQAVPATPTVKPTKSRKKTTPAS